MRSTFLLCVARFALCLSASVGPAASTAAASDVPDVDPEAAAQDVAGRAATGNPSEEGDPPPLREVIGANLEQGYIIPTAGLGNVDPLLFEAKVSPYYALSLGKGHDAVVFAFKTIVRMRYEEGFPVSTPSYMPRLIYYHYGEDPYHNGHDYYYVMVSHHSNGQKGPFYNPDGTVNMTDGEFSTNFIEMGAYSHGFADTKQEEPQQDPKRRLIRGGFAAQIHVPINRSKELEEVHYGFYRVKYWQTFLLGEEGDHKRKSRLTFSAFAILGPLHDADIWDWKRLGLDISLRQDLNWFDNLDLYLDFYTGQDYYNIRYTENITVLRVGVISDVGLAERG